MMKEEEKLLLLEDISARLPFGLAFITKQGMIEMDVINLADRYKVWAYKKKDKHGNEIGLNAETLKGERCRGKGFRLGDIKPILYPLSSITEEIFVNGSEICPMKYLAEAFDFDGYMGLYTTWNFDDKKAVVFVPKDEYEKMKEQANANAEEIEKRALEMWETKAIPWLKVSIGDTK